MKIKTIKLCGNHSTELETEIKFHIASARATSNDILNFYFDFSDDKAFQAKFSAITRILKSEKRIGKIQLFVQVSELGNQSTETAYILNKYPYIINSNLNTNSFIVKI